MDRFTLAQPILRLMTPEAAHRATIHGLRLGLGGTDVRPDDPVLAISRFGLNFTNPVGLAAGFDKNAEVVDAMLGLGFGFAEFGTVTPKAQPGNPKPRIFRLPDQQAVINRLGFNNGGLEAAAGRAARLKRRRGIVGGNIGKNKDQDDAVADYVAGAARLSPLVDYLTVNVSSPNTPGLRALQGRAILTELLSAVQAARQKPVPVLVKIAPDLTDADLDDIVHAAADSKIAGIVVSNTTIARPADLPPSLAKEAGGLSGRPLFQPSTEMLRKAYRLSGGAIPLVGVGGIASADDAYAKIRAGASLVQLYTALVYQGPGLVARIKAGLAARLKADGFARVEDAIGTEGR
ncbi:MAG TPA: quinone-dependent dihydroorotate dehydrogenase [Alphaproteobacteria bacterium]|jgi:dihydroorotate dehydrogenase|nr:quinone-dependent dihydroorotate dehydrogenase [Alphaproteobacteria bacterium]